MDKGQVVYFSRLWQLMLMDEAIEEQNKAFSVLEAVQEHLLGITDLDGFVAKLKLIRNEKGEE